MFFFEIMGKYFRHLKFFKVLAQDALADALEQSMNRTMEELLADQRQAEDDHEAFTRQLQDIYGSFSTATALVDNIKVFQIKVMNFQICLGC